MLQVRKATEADAMDIWEWRNDAATRAASLTSEVVAWADHVAWLQTALSSSNRVIYIGELSGTEPPQVGMCRFDLEVDGESAEISINLNPAHRGKKLSGALLLEAIASFRKEFRRTQKLVALIRQSNVPSKRLFVSVGFTATSMDDAVESYELRLSN